MNEIETTPARTESAHFLDDRELLRRYVAENRQDAFSEVVRRHVGLVYHAALRQLGDADQAKDVTQVVFIDLARKASALRHRSVLAGWLHTSTRFAASNVRRRETRHQRRDHESYLMRQVTTDEPVNWDQLRPVIDDALCALGDRDREAVLLRFFEGHSFAQIGVTLTMTEDAARVRVSRALEKLAGALRKRGMTSTAATLAVALGLEGAAATPAGLATHIATSALAASALGGAGLFSLMGMKVAVIVATTGALAAGGLLLRESRAVDRVQDQLAASDRQRSELTSQLSATQSQLAEAKKRLEEESADTAKLLSAIASLRSASAPGSTTAGVAGPAITAELVQSRFQKAQRLARDGQWEEALPEFLWCFDEGMVRIASLVGVRRSFLVSALGELARKYPAARAAMNERISAAEQRFNSNPADRDAPADFAALNHALGDDARTLAVYDHLPVDDPRRRSLGRVNLYDVFVDAQRYTDAVQSRPYESSLRTFTAIQEQIAAHAIPDLTSGALRKNMVTTAAKSVEALAGAGELDHAREFVAKVLAFDHSPETIAALQTRLARAGHPELMAPAIAQ